MQSAFTGSLEEDTGFLRPLPKNKLWNPKWFLLISILFSFIPVAFLYALNLSRSGFPEKRNYVLVITCLGFIILFCLGTLIPEEFGKPIFYAVNIGLAMFMRIEQTDLYQKHLANGGKSASYVIPIIMCLVFASAVIALVIYGTNVPDTKMTFVGDDLYYTSSVPQAEVTKLGDYLTQNKFFKDDNKTVAVKIHKAAGSYEFSIIADKNYYNDANFIENTKELAKILSKEVFNDKFVIINLCNDRFGVIKSVSNNKQAREEL